MARNTDNISNARADYANGAVRTGALTNTLPTAAGSTLSGTWDDWGTVSSDGVVDAVSMNVNEIEDMNGDIVMTIKTKDSYSIKFKPTEIRACILKAMFGSGNVTTGTGGDVTGYKIKGEEPAPLAWVFDFLLADARKMRVVLPRGKIKSLGEEVKKASDVMGRELEVVGLPDASSVKAYVYFAEAE